MPRKKAEPPSIGKIKDPILVVMTNSSQDEYAYEPPDIVLIQMTPSSAKSLLKRQDNLIAMIKKDDGISELSGTWYAKFFQRCNVPPLFSEEQIEDITNYEYDVLAKVFPDKETDYDEDKYKDERTEVGRVHITDRDFYWTACGKHSNGEYSSDYVSRSVVEKFVKDHSKIKK